MTLMPCSVLGMLILPIIFHAIFGTVCIHFTLSSSDDCENMSTFSYHHH